MGTIRTPAVTGISEQALQLAHPSPEIIWARALEVFGNQDKAHRWMKTALPILNDSTPEQYALSQNEEKQREVLTVLGRIDYGIYS
jgi:uncharacterized protein (DUF2384 family)